MTPAAPVLALSRQCTARNAAGEPVRLAARDAALLAWLALEGPTPRVRLAQLLWPDSEPELARNALRQRLFQLKKLLGIDIVDGGSTLTLAGGISHDLGESDEVLGDVAETFGHEFSIWLDQQRQRRRSRTRQSLVELSEMAQQAHDFADARSHAHELLALEPLSEDAHRRVIRLHYLAGDRASALRAFDHCERVLKDEVGTAPAPETLALLRHIESASLDDAAGLQPHVLPVSLLRPPRDIGRDGEREALLSAWTAEEPFVLLGEPGIGKSRLLESLARAWPGTLVVSARPGDMRVPLALVTRLVDQVCAHQPDLMQQDTVRELRTLLAPPPEAGAVRPTPRSAQQALQDALAHAAQGQPPLALAFDDWQFADDASVDLLLAVLAAPALRSLRYGHASRTLAGKVAEERLAMLQRHSAVRCVALAPLGLRAVSEFVTALQLSHVDAAPLAQALTGRVGGNPLHILETLRHMMEARVPLQADRVVAPGQVKQLVAARLKHLNDAVRQLLRVAAVAGADFGVELAEAVTDRPALALCDDWSLLEQMGLFDARGIAHDLYAEAVLDGLPVPIGRLVHARVAAWLEGRAPEPARVAAHWQAAGEQARALPHLIAAARKAWAAARAPEAFDFFRSAAAIEVAAAHPDEAFAHWFDNADAMTEIGTPALVTACVQGMQGLARSERQRLRLSLVEAVLRWMQGDVERGLHGVIALLSEAIALGDTRVECECRFAIANRAVADGRFDEALQHLAAGERLVREAGDTRRAAALSGSIAMVFGMRGQSRLAIQEYERVLPLLAQEGDHATWVVTCVAKALQHIRQGDAQAARAQIQLAMDMVARVSIAPPDTIIILRHAVDTLRWCGHFDEALRICEALDDRLALQGNFPRASDPLAHLYLQLGRPDLAQPLLNTLSHEPFARLRERLRNGLLMVQANDMATMPAATDWPDEAMDGDDLALSIEWALWSGLRAESPWPVAALTALIERCKKVQLGLLERPLRALVAYRLMQAGDAAHARPMLPSIMSLDELHAATPWAALFGAQALALAGDHDAAIRLARHGAEWVRDAARARMPQPFQDSFLQRNPVNRALLAWVSRHGGS